MIIPIILLSIIAVCILLAIRNEKWWLMAICAAVTGIWAYIGLKTINAWTVDILQFIQNDGTHFPFMAIFLFLIMSAALWQNKNERTKDEAERTALLQKAANEIKVAGFVEDNGLPDVTGWESYIKTLAERLIKSRLSNESFALGITGEWGSGKTTFIKKLQEQMADMCKVIEFNPWLCTSANLVISDFFNTLRQHIPDNDKALASDIKKYVGMLTDIDILPKPISTIVDFLTPDNAGSISQIKQSIEDKLTQSEIRYVVFIDDLDRLEHQELFEVLRLIRITASFSNLMFVVSYDRRHIRQMLRANNIKDGDQFVKKIFNTEIVLPELEPYILPQMLLDELTRMLGEESTIPDLLGPAIMSKNTLNVYNILPYLQNYRDVKRFAMAFVADLGSNERNSEEYSFEDFFWLELLRYSDYDTYNELRNYPSNYLTDQDTILVLKTDFKEKGCKPKTMDLLKRLFHQQGRRANSISCRNNFHNYFSFRLQKDKISNKEFKELLATQGESLGKRLHDYYNENKIMSLYEHIRITPIKELADDKSRKNYLTLTIMMIAYMNRPYIKTVCDVLSLSKFDGLNKELLSAHTKEVITKIVEEGKLNRGTLCLLFTSLHTDIQYDQHDEEYERYNYQSILEDDYLVAASEKNMQKILESIHPAIDITETFVYDSWFRKLLEASTKIVSTDVSYEPIVSNYKCLPFAAVLSHFKQHPSTELDKFMSPIQFEEDERAYYDEPVNFNAKLNTIEKIVGSKENFKQLITECFTVGKEEKESWLKYWKMGW